MNDRTYRQEHEEAMIDRIVQDILIQSPRLAGTSPDQIRASFLRVLENPDVWRALGQQHMAHADEIERYVAERKKKQP